MIKYQLYSLMVLAIIVFSASSTVKADNEAKDQSIQLIKINQSIALTGRLDNPMWLQSEPVELNYEVTPGENTPAPQKTLVWSFYDNNFIYFGFQCFDTNPDQIRANISERDKMYQDDWVFVAIDTYGDYQRSYEFCVNPFGIQGDLLATINGEDASVDWIWQAAASKNDHGWTAEMAIPFSSLNFPNNEEQSWRINILRTIPRESRTQISWTRLDRNIPGIMTQAGFLKGLKNIKPGSTVELLPYAIGQKMGSLSDRSNPNSGMKYEPAQGRIGGGIKYSPGPNFALDAVINPDFSQIETDAAQINVNTTFALQYDEKRPFFLIGRELLQTPMYYSRSINDPAGAARIIGKTGSLSYQYMSAYDRNTVFDIPGEEGSNTFGTNLKSLVNIGRLRYDIGDETYIGSMLFAKDLSGGHNYVGGIDWNYKFWSNWYFTGEGFLSQTKELNDTATLNTARVFGHTAYNAAFNGEQYTGTGLHLNLSHSERSYNFGFTFNDFSPTYQAYTGIFSQTGIRQYYMSHEYVFYPQNSFMDQGSVGFGSSLVYDFYGMKKEQVVQPYISLTLKGQTNIFVQHLLVNDENFRGIWFYGIHRAYYSVNSRPLNEVSLSTYGSFGKFIYRTSSPTMGKGHSLGASITLKPTSQLNVSFSYDRARLSSVETGELYYDGNIYRAVAIYQLSSEIFFRTIIQYNTFDAAYQLYPLFSYKLNAFTTFYAGATSDYYNYHGAGGIVNTDQQYFVKVQYLVGI
jgi:hypothetical protein